MSAQVNMYNDEISDVKSDKMSVRLYILKAQLSDSQTLFLILYMPIIYLKGKQKKKKDFFLILKKSR